MPPRPYLISTLSLCPSQSSPVLVPLWKAWEQTYETHRTRHWLKGLKTLALRTLEFKLENNGQGTPTIIKSWLQCSGLVLPHTGLSLGEEETGPSDCDHIDNRQRDNNMMWRGF